MTLTVDMDTAYRIPNAGKEMYKSTNQPTGQQNELMIESHVPVAEHLIVEHECVDFSVLCSHAAIQTLGPLVNNQHITGLVVNQMKCKGNVKALQLSKSALRVLTDPNAGGASELSEAVSYELLSRVFSLCCEPISLLHTEMNIDYRWRNGKKTDYLITFNKQVDSMIAVSVTRAMKYSSTFTYDDGYYLMYKKLNTIQVSNHNVEPHHQWKKQILHIFTQHQYIIDILTQIYQQFQVEQPHLIGNTVVLITLSENADFLYSNNYEQWPKVQTRITNQTAQTDAHSIKQHPHDAATTCIDTSVFTLYQHAAVIDLEYEDIEMMRDNEMVLEYCWRIFEKENELADQLQPQKELIINQPTMCMSSSFEASQWIASICVLELARAFTLLSAVCSLAQLLGAQLNISSHGPEPLLDIKPSLITKREYASYPQPVQPVPGGSPTHPLDIGPLKTLACYGHTVKSQFNLACEPLKPSQRNFRDYFETSHHCIDKSGWAISYPPHTATLSYGVYPCMCI